MYAFKHYSNYYNVLLKLVKYIHILNDTLNINGDMLGPLSIAV